MQPTNSGTNAGANGERASGASHTVASAVEAGKASLSRVADSATEAGKQRLDAGIGRAADQVEQVGDALSEAAARLGSSDQLGGLAAYTGRLADSLGELAERIRTRSIEDLTADARQAARSNPVLFLAGSVAVGFALTRILKAGTTATEPGGDGEYAAGEMPATQRAAPAMTDRTPATRAVTAGAKAAARAITAACAVALAATSTCRRRRRRYRRRPAALEFRVHREVLRLSRALLTASPCRRHRPRSPRRRAALPIWPVPQESPPIGRSMSGFRRQARRPVNPARPREVRMTEHSGSPPEQWPDSAGEARGARGVPGLVRGLVDDFAHLARQQVELAKREMREAVGSATDGLVSLLAGGAILFVGNHLPASGRRPLSLALHPALGQCPMRRWCCRRDRIGAAAASAQQVAG